VQRVAVQQRVVALQRLEPQRAQAQAREQELALAPVLLLPEQELALVQASLIAPAALQQEQQRQVLAPRAYLAEESPR